MSQENERTSNTVRPDASTASASSDPSASIPPGIRTAAGSLPSRSQPEPASIAGPGSRAGSSAGSESAFVVWALYDCSEIVSLHTTRNAALAARLAHLEALRPVMCEPGDEELFRNATTIIPMRVYGDDPSVPADHLPRRAPQRAELP